MPVPPDHREYSDRDIAREAGERREGDATNQAAIQREAVTRQEADEALRTILRVKEGAILVPKVALYAVALPLLGLLAGGAWYMSEQAARTSYMQTAITDNRAQSVATDQALSVATQTNSVAVSQMDNKLTRIQAQLEYLVQTTAPPKGSTK